MRTTLNVADDVLIVVRERARRERRSVGDVLSDLARQALTTRRREWPESTFHGFSPIPPRGQPVTTALIDELREDGPE